GLYGSWYHTGMLQVFSDQYLLIEHLYRIFFNWGQQMSLIGKDLTIQKSDIFDINRRVTAHATSSEWGRTPHATYLYEPDITEFYTHFQEHRGRHAKGHPITFTALMLKAIAESLKASPRLNAILQYNHHTKVGIHHHIKEISIAIPFLLPDKRIITPIIHDVGEKSLCQIASDIFDVKRRVKNTDIDAMQYVVAKKELVEHLKLLRLGVIRQYLHTKIGKNKLPITREQIKRYQRIPDTDKITTKDIFDTSVLVSNLGSVFQHQRGGITLLDLISPQVFSIAINAIQDRPSVYMDSGKQAIGVRKILPLSLTIDHRALDGADFIPFQDNLDRIFSNPGIIDTWCD
ncbi:MAG: 2-oxo acid dehydrogenase subunit E2, partial [Candidatus Thermoplasmatota archaeon]|nr:2-oxo acid dehydrogenase subunit E2 [Candidatus Thermoplasmatota archaeon]